MVKKSIFLLLLGIFTTTEAATQAHIISALAHHLFDPIPQQPGANTRFIAMLARINEQVAAGADLKKTVMQESRTCILDELTLAFAIVTKIQGGRVEHAEIHAQEYMRYNIEELYEKECGKPLFEEDPATLPKHFFAIYFAPYTIPYFLERLVPEPSRSPAYMDFLISVRIMLHYATDIIAILHSILTLLGVPVNP